MSSRKKKSTGTPLAPRARNGHGRQRQRLIDACISALHRYGPSRTTVEKVVALAKMSPGIVRFYFDSKAAMLIASLQFLSTEFEQQLLMPVAKLKHRPVAALKLMVELYLDPVIASPRKVSVWYAFWGEASSRQEYYDICGQKDERFAALVRELIEALIIETGQPQLDADGIALGLIGALEILWQDFAFKTEEGIDRALAMRRSMAYLRSIFPGSFAEADEPRARAGAQPLDRFANGVYDDAQIHALERDLIFRSSWAVVGHQSQIPHAGDFLTIDVGTERVLVVRDLRGALRAWRNSCSAAPHALVLERGGRFETDSVDCKAHRLRFSFDRGRVGGTDGHQLRELELRSVGGLLFVLSGSRGRQNPVGPAPEAWFDEDPPQTLMNLCPPTERAVAADWKVVVEQWLASSKQAYPPPPDVDFLAWHASIADDTGWSAARYRHLVDCVPPKPWRRRFIVPNHLLESRPDGLSIIQAVSSGAGRCMLRRLDYSVLPPDESARATLYVAARLGPYVRRATLALAESTQQGLVQLDYEARCAATSPLVHWFHRRLVASVPALGGARPPRPSSNLL